MKKISKVVVATGLSITLCTSGLVMADNLSLKSQAVNLIAQLKDTMLQTKASLGSASASKEIYHNALSSIYTTLGLDVPSDEELNSLTPSDIEALLQDYAKNLDSGNIGTDSDLYKQIKTEVELEVINSVNSKLNTAYTDINEMLNELDNMQTNSDTSEKARINYLNKLQAIFQVMGEDIPTGEELMAMSYDVVANKVSAWAEVQTNNGIANSIEQHKQQTYQELITSLGITGKADSQTIIDYVNSLKTQMDNNQASSEADMQEVVNELKRTLEDIGETPDTNYEEEGSANGNTQPNVQLSANAQAIKDCGYEQGDIVWDNNIRFYTMSSSLATDKYSSLQGTVVNWNSNVNKYLVNITDEDYNGLNN